jgi:hypothetical protein
MSFRTKTSIILVACVLAASAQSALSFSFNSEKLSAREAYSTPLLDPVLADAKITKKQNTTPTNWLGLISGWASGFMLHEGGHLAAGQMVGVSSHYTGGVNGTLIFDNPKALEGRRISQGGFMAQILSSELILRGQFHQSSDYALGMLIFNLTNPLFYMAANEINEEGHGDLHFFENSGGDKDALYGILLGHTSISLLRAFTGIETNSWVYVNGDEIVLGINFSF